MQANCNSSPTLRGIAVASVGMGFFSLVVFWWYPFALILSSVGLLLALICIAFKIRGGLHGENLAVIGATICSMSAGTIITLTQILHVMMWDR
ncbi:MAG: hypothetical protein K8T89_11800 [Planctomycetes bacterium]|nr:hypothetical protein [Planctomycetota bacterium]